MNIEGFRRAGHAAVERIAKYYETLEDRPVSALVEPGAIGSMVQKTPPEKSEDFEGIAKDFDRVILPGITHWQHPSFFSYFPANSTFESIIADMFAGAVSNPGFNWSCSPSATELEVVMMDWVAKMLGLCEEYQSTSERGGGIILGSASEAALTVAAPARERALQYLFALDLATHSPAKANPTVYGADGAPIPSTRPPPPLPAFENMSQSQRAELTGRLVMYGSTQTHSLGKKAAMILGLQWRAIETFAEDDWALRGASLRKALEEDSAQGLVPFLLIATLGTTSSGAKDHLDEITAVGADFPSLWIHVDAAWAGVYLSLPEARSELFLDALNEGPKASTSKTEQNGQNPSASVPDSVLKVPGGVVHSFSTNLHKAGLVTFDLAVLYVRERTLLTDALDITPPFLRTKHGDAGTVIDYRSWQLPLGRRFRSIKIYFVLRSYGLEGFRAHLRRSIKLAEQFEGLVRDSKEIELVTARSLGLIVFRLNPAKNQTGTRLDEAELDKLNRELNVALQARSEIALISTVIGTTFCIRFAIGSPQTRAEHIDDAWKTILQCAEEAKDATGIGMAIGASARN